jgi:hypothetical protein
MKTKRDDLDRQHVRDRRKQQTATAMAHADDAVASPCSGGARRVEYVTPLGERLPVRHPAARRQPPPAHVAQAHLPPATRLRARRVGCRAARRWIALLQRHWGNMPEARRQPGRVIGDPLPRKHPKRPRTRAPGARPPLCSTSDTDCCDSTGGARQFVGADRGRMVEWACRALFAGSWPSATPRRSSSDCGSARWCSRPSRPSERVYQGWDGIAFAIPMPATSVPSTLAVPRDVCCSNTVAPGRPRGAARGGGHPDRPRHCARRAGPTRRDARTPRSRCRGRAPPPSLSDLTRASR